MLASTRSMKLAVLYTKLFFSSKSVLLTVPSTCVFLKDKLIIFATTAYFTIFSL